MFGKYSPKPSTSVGCISKADPECGSSLSHAKIQHHGHGNDGHIGDISRIYECLLGLLGQRLPATNSLLCCDVRADSIDIQIQRNIFGRDRKNRVLVGRVCECRCVVNDNTGKGAELGLDCIEERWD